MTDYLWREVSWLCDGTGSGWQTYRIITDGSFIDIDGQKLRLPRPAPWDLHLSRAEETMTKTQRRLTVAAVLVALLAAAAVATAAGDLVPAFDDDLPRGQVNYP